MRFFFLLSHWKFYFDDKENIGLIFKFAFFTTVEICAVLALFITKKERKKLSEIIITSFSFALPIGKQFKNVYSKSDKKLKEN